MEGLDARRALLDRLIDHAPTFPPASLASQEALAEDARAVRSPHSFALARLVWPASRLGEILGTERGVSAVLDASLPENTEIEAVEVRYRDDLVELQGLAEEVYVEVPSDEALETRLDAVAELGLRAKVRCGGAVVPSDAELAGFVRACRERALVFKATAGLHHAVGSNGEHGFLNLLAAVVFEGREKAALAETDSNAFALHADGFSWQGQSVGTSELVRARQELFHSIGSCSFFEPVEELQALGMLPS
jgi:hypothetical protein